MNSRRFRFVTVAALQAPPEVCSLRAFPASCEAAFVSLPWFFQLDLLFQAQILGLPERVLAEVPRRQQVKVSHSVCPSN